MTATRSSTWLDFFACGLLAVAVFATFGRAANAPFFFDDYPGIVDNPSIRQLWPVSVPLNPPPSSTTGGRPLVNLSFAVNYRLNQLRPLGYRVVNMAIHAASAMLLFGIARRTLRASSSSWIPAEARSIPCATGSAFVIALIWALHPLQTETVCYATQRTESLMGLCMFATLYASLRYWQAESGAARRSWLVLATVACAAGMASKEVMVTAPVLVLIYDYTFSGRPVRRLLVDSWPLYLGLAATWFLLAYLIADSPHSESAGFNLGVPATTWWLTQCEMLTMYLRLAFWPWPQSIHYELPYLSSWRDACPYLVVVGVLILGMLVALLRRHPLGFLGAWFFMILSPTLVIPIITEIAAERRMHLPLAAVVTVVVIGAARCLLFLTNRVSERWIVAAGTVAALALAAVSYQRLAAYQSESSIWFDAVTQYPESDMIQIGLAAALRNERRDTEALSHYRAAVRLNPENADFRFKLAQCYRKLGDTDAAAREFGAAARLAPDVAKYRDDFAKALRSLERYPEVIQELNAALALDPDNRDARFNLALTYTAVGNHAEAIQQYKKLVLSNPADANSHYGLANELLTQGLNEAALDHLEKAILLRPTLTAARNNLGAVLLRVGRIDEAIVQFEECVRAEPSSPIGEFNLANALSEAGRRSEAISHARRAWELARSGDQTELVPKIETWITQIETANAK